MAARNKNIFIRKETAFSVLHGNGHPVFANVIGYDPAVGNVVYEVDYPVSVKKHTVIWHSEIVESDPTIYVKTLDDFLSRFAPDVFDEYRSYTE